MLLVLPLTLASRVERDAIPRPPSADDTLTFETEVTAAPPPLLLDTWSKAWAFMDST